MASKKTQRDKDWPMLRRLVEVSYDRGFASPTPEQIHFWLRELRTPALLIEGAHTFAEAAHQLAAHRPALRAALVNDEAAVLKGLADDEAHERELDRAYWAPLRAELERLRRR